MPELAEVQESTKKAFISRPNSNADKIEKEEKELEELIKEQESTEENSGHVIEDDNALATPEEKTFKKRYGDLRRHSQKQREDYENKLAALKTQLTAATNQQIKLHPDFSEIRGSDDFHDWAEEQPSWVQNSLYENDTDAYSAARAIDLYKADRNLTGSTKAKSTDNSEAAKSVNTRASRSKPQSENTSGMIKESDVDQMSSQEYENNEKEIMESIRNGKFIYDVSGSAR